MGDSWNIIGCRLRRMCSQLRLKGIKIKLKRCSIDQVLMACIDVCQIALTVPALLGNSQQSCMGYLGYPKEKLGKPPGASECSLRIIEFLDGVEGCMRIELTEYAKGSAGWTKSSWQLSHPINRGSSSISLNRPMQQIRLLGSSGATFSKSIVLSWYQRSFASGRFKSHRSHANSDTGSTAGAASRIFSESHCGVSCTQARRAEKLRSQRRWPSIPDESDRAWRCCRWVSQRASTA